MWLRIKQFARWIWFALFIVSIIVLVLVLKGKAQDIRPEILDRLADMRARHKAERDVINATQDAAVTRIEIEYREALDNLGKAQTEEAHGLRQDPVELARFLARAGRTQHPR